ncbi:MAG: CopG family transcriptional regulator [Deltaproteobacteria bacterium]|nr:CopG family transcriptional regulator [Deltaproteobacteria bacterium]
MGTISLNLPDQMAKISKQCAKALRLSRAEYIRRAINEMNRATNARMRADRIAKASLRVREESMRVNAEFAGIEEDPGA